MIQGEALVFFNPAAGIRGLPCPPVASSEGGLTLGGRAANERDFSLGKLKILSKVEGLRAIFYKEKNPRPFPSTSSGQVGLASFNMAKIEIKRISFTRMRPLLLPILALGLIYFSFSYLLKPRIDTINHLFNSIKKEEKELTKLTEKSSFLKSLNEAELVKRSELVLQALPENKNPMYVMRLLRRLCAETGVTLGRISVDPGQVATDSAKGKTEETPSLEYSLLLEGNIDQVSALIRQLAVIFPLIRLETMSLDGSFDGGRVEMATDVSAYFVYLPQSLGEVSAPVRVITDEEKRLSDRLQEFSSPAPVFDGTLLPPVESGKENPFI